MLYPETWLNSFISSNSFWWISQDSLYTRSHHLQTEMNLLLPFQSLFLFFCSLTPMVRTFDNWCLIKSDMKFCCFKRKQSQRKDSNGKCRVSIFTYFCYFSGLGILVVHLLFIFITLHFYLYVYTSLYFLRDIKGPHKLCKRRKQCCRPVRIPVCSGCHNSSRAILVSYLV